MEHIEFEYNEDQLIFKHRGRNEWRKNTIIGLPEGVWMFECDVKGIMVVQVYEVGGKWHLTTTIKLLNMVQTDHTVAHERSNILTLLNQHLIWFQQRFVRCL